MRFPSLSRREQPASTADDTDRDGTVATDTRIPEGSTVEERADDDAATQRGGAATTGATATRRPANERTASGRVATERPANERPAAEQAETERTDIERAAAERAATERATDRTTTERAATDQAAAERAAARAAVAPGPRPTRDRDRITDRDPEADRDPDVDRDTTVTDRHRTDRDHTDRDRTDRDHTDPDRTDRDATLDRDRVPAPDETRAPVGPRPRASMLATLGLIVGVAGVLFVLTGILAGYGIGVGAAGAVLAVLGLIATRRRHIAGKSDALLGIAFGLGAVVLGVLAMTGQYDWPSTDGDLVARFREWLDSQFVDRL
ncbi:thrombospondin [Micromonospora sp. WMMD1082]|uniref:thrombospondin n=1 Tax=Micromonospora sp. WMMD1082 TaxID=3016104 RepID=UPI002416EFF9|nr:thrombospondin [Micromonospora sp. WMMD1082]MDG4793748.1 thrombospondin [Micromonospora sp. WMMD1082]